MRTINSTCKCDFGNFLIVCRTFCANRRFMTEIWTPAEVVFHKIGSPEVVAKIVGKDRTTVMQWRYARSRRRAGDIPGDEEKRTLLRYAREHGIPLTAEELIFGAAVEVTPITEEFDRPVAAE